MKDEIQVEGWKRRPIKERWTEICNEYLIEFCKRHEYEYNPQYDIINGYAWVGGDPGTIANVCDMFISMEDIRYDVDTEQPEERFEKWYWKALELHELGLPYMNYQSFCKGAPDQYTDEQLKHIRESKNKIEKQKEELDNYIKELGGNPGKMLF